MKIENKHNYNNYKPKFGAKLGWRAAYELKNNPEKFAGVTKSLKEMGEPTTVVDIMTQNTRKGKMYSLRLFNEIFGEQHNIPLLRDNNNKDIVSSSAKDFISSLENLTKTTVESKEYSLFNKIRNDYSSSLPMMKYLKGIINKAKENGKYLSPASEQTLSNKF